MNDEYPNADLKAIFQKSREEIQTLRVQLAEAHDELEKTNSDLLQLTLELDDRVAERTDELVRVNRRLKKEIEERKRAETEVRRHRDHLEEIVSERTAKLKSTNLQLENNIEELASSEERFRSLVTTIPDIIYRIDEAGRFLFLNDAVRQLGWDPSDLVGRHFSEFILPSDVERISRNHVLPQYAGKSTGVENAPKLFDERRTRDRKTTGLEILLPIKRTGEKRPGLIQAIGKETIVAEVNSSGLYSTSPRSAQKVLIGTVGVIRDISARKRVEKQLAESETRLMTILENIQAGVVVIDAESRQIVEANPAALRMIGGSGVEVFGAVCHRFICSAEQDKCPVLDLGQTVDTSERELLTHDGPGIPILKTVVPFELEGRKHLLETFLDITEIQAARDLLERSHRELESKVEERTAHLRQTNRKLVEEVRQRKRVERQLTNAMEELKRSQLSLVQAEKMSAIGVLTAGIAHELNNPLMGMLNFILYCLKHTEPGDRRYEVLEDTVKETERCIKIVRNLLIFSRMEDVEEEHPQHARLEEMVDRVLRLLEYRIEKDSVRVERNFDPDLPKRSLKVGNFQQVLLNLVGNALDALQGRPDPRLRLNLFPSDLGIHIEVEDNGCGVPVDLQSRIFDPFFTTKPPGKGTGLGLSVCKSIVESHGGTIECRPAPGAGASFRILLPENKEAAFSKREGAMA